MIRFDRATKRYAGAAAPAVDALDLDIASGEMVAFAGASGCGKTTSLKMVNRLIEPTSGAVHVAGRDVRDQDLVALRRSIGYVFQGVGLFPHMSVADNVAVLPRLLGWDRGAIDRAVDAMLERVRLPPAQFRGRRPGELSGGQQQRVGFARALVARPAALLLDEPFGALDPVTRDGLQQELRSLQRDLGLTAILVTHDMSEALLLADRVAVLEGGRLRRVDTPAGLLRDPGCELVRTLVETPRRAAEAIEAMLHGAREKASC